MDLRKLRHLVALGEELHFSRAADRVGIEQSALSESIKHFELEHGVRFFDRTSRTTHLASVGRELMPHAKCLLAYADYIEKSIPEWAGGRLRRVRIGMSDFIAQPRASQLLKILRTDFPDTALDVESMTVGQQRLNLEMGLIHLGFSGEGATGPHVHVEPLWSDRLIVAVPASHALAQQRRVDVLGAYPDLRIYSHLDTGRQSTRAVLRLMGQRSGEPLKVQYVATFQIMMTLVGAGLGLGMTTVAHARSVNPSDVVCRSWSGRGSKITTYLSYREGELSELLRRIIERAKTIP